MLAHQLLELRGRSHKLVVECMRPTMDRIRLLNGNHSIKIVRRLRALTLYPDLSLSYQHIHGGGSRFWMRAKTPMVEIVNIDVLTSTLNQAPLSLVPDAGRPQGTHLSASEIADLGGVHSGLTSG